MHPSLFIDRRIQLAIYKDEPGIYQFDSESATGKTRLSKLAKEYNSYGDPIDSYNYYDYRHKRNMLDMMDCKAIFIDRYDMYNGEFADSILELGKNHMVFIDCKSSLLIDTPCRMATIEMEEGRISIY
jgi:hypothetical protein